jgi:hypothetical protein
MDMACPLEISADQLGYPAISIHGYRSAIPGIHETRSTRLDFGCAVIDHAKTFGTIRLGFTRESLRIGTMPCTESIFFCAVR